MLNLRILILLSIIGLINCANIKFGEETENGHWGTIHRISFPFTVGGKHYFFGLTDLTGGRYWLIQELKEDGKTGSETSTGTWNNYYTHVFPFAINDKHFIYGIDDRNYWFTQEILPGGLMGREIDNGYWKSTPKIIFPFYIGSKQYVYSQLTNKNWFIREILQNGKMGSDTENGSWQLFMYNLCFPFSINGRQYFYCVNGNVNWFIQELVAYGKMGVETDHGSWKSNHLVYVPFNIDGKYYFYGATHEFWFIQELLPGGKMGTEKAKGSWQFFYPVSFSFNINGRQYLYGFSNSNYYWFIQEIIQEPRFPIITTTEEKYCNEITYCEVLIRTKRQNNKTTKDGTCDSQCGGSGGLNAIEEYITAIQNDHINFLTMTFHNRDNNPLTSVSTYRVHADANHATFIDLTAAMTAEIHYGHMAPVRDPAITAEVRAHLRQMDRKMYDEAGHLLASSLGGAGVLFNFAPQSPSLNRAVNVAGSVVPQPGWFEVEAMLRDYLLEVGENGGFIRWSLAPLYSRLPISRRPTNFLLSIRFYDNQRNLVNWRMEGAVRSYNFLNVPRSACTTFNHTFWNS